MFQVICIGSTGKDIFFPTGDGTFLDTPEDIEAREKVMFEVGAKYQIEDRYEAPGGVAANGAQGLSRLGITTAVYSCVGDDQIGDWVTTVLEKEGVDVSLLTRVPESWTDLSAILVFTRTGERTIFFNRDANEHLSIQPEKLSDTEWFFVSALNGTWQENLQAILTLARERGVKLALNPGQKNLKENVQAVIEAVRETAVLLLNKDEALEIVAALQPDVTRDNLNDETFLLNTLHQAGARVIGLTDGKRGAWGSDGTRIFHADSTVKVAVDATGCGDAFGSAFLSAWIKHADIENALQWGVVNGGNVALFYGAQEGLLRAADIEKRAADISLTVLP